MGEGTPVNAATIQHDINGTPPSRTTNLPQRNLLANPGVELSGAQHNNNNQEHASAHHNSQSPIDMAQYGYWPVQGKTQHTLGEMYPAHLLQKSCWLRTKRFYRFYIQPMFWVIVAIVFACYWYVVMNNIATYRTNSMADFFGYNKPRPQLPADSYPSPDNKALFDIGHERIAAAYGTDYANWVIFLNTSLAVGIVSSIGLRLVLRDWVRVTEYCAVAAVLFFLSGFVHIMTSYPDPWGTHESCQNPANHVLGRWVFTRLKFEFCGDQMWSGHTFNFTIAIIMLRRVIYDYMGWGAIPLSSLTHTVVSFNKGLVNETEETNRRSSITVNRSYEPAAINTNDANHYDVEKQTVPHIASSTYPQVSQSALFHLSEFKLRFNTILPQYIDASSAATGKRAIEMPGCSSYLMSEFANERAHLMNPYFRYRINGLARERVIMSTKATPAWAVSYPIRALVLTTFLRLFLLAWMVMFYVTVLKVRFHYTADVLIGILVSVFLSCSTGFLQWMVTWLYMPVDSRYSDAPRYPFSCDPQLYEERLSKVGVGGLL